MVSKRRTYKNANVVKVYIPFVVRLVDDAGLKKWGFQMSQLKQAVRACKFNGLTAEQGCLPMVIFGLREAEHVAKLINDAFTDVTGDVFSVAYVVHVPTT